MDSNIATVLFAAIVAALIAVPATTVAPPRSATVALAQLTGQNASAQPALNSCSRQTWPNLDNSCLRYANDRPSTDGIRVIAADR